MTVGMASPSPDAPPARPPWRWLCLLALLPALDAVLRLGRLHPDEVFQHLEPALHQAFGIGRLSWEWEVGLRNWAVPGLFSWLLRLGHAVGLDDAQGRRALLEVPQYALHVAFLGAVWRLTFRRVGAPAAHLAAGLVGTYPLLTWFAGRTTSESLSAAFLVWGLERLDAPDERLRTPALGGLLLGAAEVVRYGSAAFIVPALLVLAAQRRFRALGAAVVGGAVAALGLAVLDKLTWGQALAHPRMGGWGHSLFEYLDFNVFSGRAAQQFGAEPPAFYLSVLVVLAPWAWVGLGRWAVQREARAWLFAVPAVVYTAVVSYTPHKEARFLEPALVLLAVGAVPAFAGWAWPQLVGPRGVGQVLAAALCLAPLGLHLMATPLDVQRPEQFQLTVRAGREAHGFILMNEGLWGSGGTFYLGRDLPWCMCDTPDQPCFQMGTRDPRVDRAVYFIDSTNPGRNAQTLAAFEQAGFHRVEVRGQAWYLAR